MSLCIRAVIETWGESMTYSSRETDIWDQLAGMAEMAGIEPGEYAVTEYGDMQVFWVNDGARFLNFLADKDAVMLRTIDRESETVSDDPEERERELGDVKEICGMAGEWRKSIDPADGSLRIYCD